MSARERFAEMATRPNETIALDRAALLIAAEEYPGLPVEHYLAEIDGLADDVRRRLQPDAGPHETLVAINRVLIEERGFTGNREDYYDPRNSYLNEALERRTGIPITLSLVYMEVARRIEFPMAGVGFPGHFLVKHVHSDGEIIIDPFHAGTFMTEPDLQSRLDDTFGGGMKLRDEMLRETPRRQILFRMLNNLKGIYSRRRDSARALAAVERMLLIVPSSPAEIRDRGVLLSELRRPLEAISELSSYRRMAPGAEDGETVDRLLERLRHQVGMSN